MSLLPKPSCQSHIIHPENAIVISLSLSSCSSLAHSFFLSQSSLSLMNKTAKLKYARTHPPVHAHAHLCEMTSIGTVNETVDQMYTHFRSQNESRFLFATISQHNPRGKTITPKMSNGASPKNRLCHHEPARFLGKKLH